MLSTVGLFVKLYKAVLSASNELSDCLFVHFLLPSTVGPPYNAVVGYHDAEQSALLITR